MLESSRALPKIPSHQRFPAASRAVIRLNARKCLIPVRLGDVPAALPGARTFSAQHESKWLELVLDIQAKGMGQFFRF
jgi:hypothetical protein